MSEQIINNDGRCYVCNKPIEEGQEYYRYVSLGLNLSHESERVSLFHKGCFERLPASLAPSTAELLIMDKGAAK